MVPRSQAESLRQTSSTPAAATLTIVSARGPLLFFPHEKTERSTRKPIRLTKLVFEKAEVGCRDVIRMADEKGKHRWLDRDLSDERGFGDLRRFSLSYGQGMNG